MAFCTAARSSGCVRARTISTLAKDASSYPKILKVSVDQVFSPVAMRQAKVPVRLNRCAWARYASLCRRAFSACLRSSMSVDDPYHLTMLPDIEDRKQAEN